MFSPRIYQCFCANATGSGWWLGELSGTDYQKGQPVATRGGRSIMPEVAARLMMGTFMVVLRTCFASTSIGHVDDRAVHN